MCDRCILRERAYEAADPETRAAADALDAQTAESIATIVTRGMFAQMRGEDDTALRTEYEDAMISKGEALDVLLGLIAPPTVPDSIPDEWL